MFKRISLIAAAALFAANTHAGPVAISQKSANATTYSFFVIKAKKLRGTLQQGIRDLALAIAPYGVTPCIVAADSNAAISCGVPGDTYSMQPAVNEFFTYDLAFNMKDLPPINDRKGLNKDGAYNQVYAVNFLQPVGLTPGDAAGRNPVHVRFAVPVTEFSFMVDGGNPIAMASDAVRLSVNGVPVDPVALVPGTPTFVGIADAAGFTEVTIEGVAGYTQAFIADAFSFVPMQ